jgi:homoserine dehydrogenase
LSLTPEFGPLAKSVDEFLDRTQPDVAIEITTLKPETGEPAISHIRSALLRNIHVIAFNKELIAHAYADLSEEARRVQAEFRFESTVMDGAPIFKYSAKFIVGGESCRLDGTRQQPRRRH